LAQGDAAEGDAAERGVPEGDCAEGGLAQGDAAEGGAAEVGPAEVGAVEGGDGMRIRGGGRWGELVVRVADSGAGIEPELAEEIFTRGWTSKNEAGHGIGLALVRRAVHGNGGAIGVTADPLLGGAAVTVRLPAAARVPAQASGAHAEAGR
jgi:signal transduction histidine kinase